MADIRLDLSLRQEQKLSTQMVQTMETIAMPAQELNEKIRKEAETNPVLVIKDRSPSYSEFASRYSSATDRRESYSDSSYGEDSDGQQGRWIEGMVSSRESLSEHLLSQLWESDAEKPVLAAASVIITAMDGNGFLPSPPEELLPPESRQYAQAAMDIIHTLEPLGVGALNWRDSLIIQARGLGMRSEELSLFTKLVDSHLEQMRLGKADEVASELGTDTEEVNALFSFLKTLTPFPGRKYSSGYDEIVIPEISIRKEDGKLRMKLERDAVPSVEIDASYRDMAAELKGTRSEEGRKARKFLSESIASAESLISQLEARASMLEKVGTFLMARQQPFFLEGPLYLKAITLKEAADEIGVHETTVGRIASSKYIDTDWGIFPIRDLFTSGVKAESGDTVSRSAVKEMIKLIIQENTSGKALSDQKISDMLAAKGIKAARRTVSKYRKELDIESSYGRSQ